MFSSEENFQNAIDFLNSIGDENFDNWENHYGFKSLRRSPDFEKVHQKTDNLFATLLNDNSEIIVGANRFKVDFANEKIHVRFASELTTGAKGSIIDNGPEMVFNFADDIFFLLEKGIGVKGTYCGGRDVQTSVDLIFVDVPVYFRVRCYTIGIYNTVSIHANPSNALQLIANGTIEYGFHTNFGESSWKNNSTRGTFDNISWVTFDCLDLEARPYSRTRRLNYLYLNVDFYTIHSIPGGSVTTNELSLSICCHSPGCAD